MLRSTSGGTFIALPPVRRIEKSVMENKLYCLLYRVLPVMTMILSCSWKLVLSCILLSYYSGDAVIENNILTALLASESTVFYCFSLPWALVPTLLMSPATARVTLGNGGGSVTASLPVSPPIVQSTGSCASTRQRERREKSAARTGQEGVANSYSVTAKGLTMEWSRAVGAKHGLILHFLTMSTVKVWFHEVDSLLAVLGFVFSPSLPLAPAQCRWLL